MGAYENLMLSVSGFLWHDKGTWEPEWNVGETAIRSYEACNPAASVPVRRKRKQREGRDTGGERSRNGDVVTGNSDAVLHIESNGSATAVTSGVSHQLPTEVIEIPIHVPRRRAPQTMKKRKIARARRQASLGPGEPVDLRENNTIASAQKRGKKSRRVQDDEDALLAAREPLIDDVPGSTEGNEEHTAEKVDDGVLESMNTTSGLELCVDTSTVASSVNPLEGTKGITLSTRPARRATTALVGTDLSDALWPSSAGHVKDSTGGNNNTADDVIGRDNPPVSLVSQEARHTCCIMRLSWGKTCGCTATDSVGNFDVHQSERIQLQ
eukprot:m.596416 g.596416  ORF g.596416 m.596416 type:complete len:325 (+) comp22409_c0_seq15:2-976(+)